MEIGHQSYDNKNWIDYVVDWDNDNDDYIDNDDGQPSGIRLLASSGGPSPALLLHLHAQEQLQSLYQWPWSWSWSWKSGHLKVWLFPKPPVDNIKRFEFCSKGNLAKLIFSHFETNQFLKKLCQFFFSNVRKNSYGNIGNSQKILEKIILF